jgi:hypothetical protein
VGGFKRLSGVFSVGLIDVITKGESGLVLINSHGVATVLEPSFTWITVISDAGNGFFKHARVEMSKWRLVAVFVCLIR